MALAASVPHPRLRLPVLGDVVGMSPAAPMQSLVRDARGLGPLFVRRLLGEDIVVAAGVDVVAELADEDRFEKAVVGPVEDFRELTADGLFTAYNGDERWQVANDVLTPGFTKQAMAGYHDTLADSCLRVLDRWGPAARFDAFEQMRRITVDVIGRCGLGHDFEAYRRTGEHPFTAGWRRCARHWQLRTFLPMLDRLPGGRARRARHLATIAGMRSFVDELVAARLGEQAGRSDLLGRMVAARAGGAAMTAADIRDQVLTLIIAGHDTSAAALAFALNFLARDPGLQTALRAEVAAIAGPDPAVVPTFDQVAKLRAVRRVVDEAQRLWPPAPAFARQARADTTLAGRYPMSRGEWAVVVVPALHRDPSAWPDPLTFDHDRFLPSAIRARHAHAYKPFGTGPRACIGRQLALHEVVLTLAMIVARFDVTLDRDRPLVVGEAATLYPRRLALSVTRRS